MEKCLIAFAVVIGIAYISGAIGFYNSKTSYEKHAGLWPANEAFVGATMWPKYAVRAIIDGWKKVQARDVAECKALAEKATKRN